MSSFALIGLEAHHWHPRGRYQRVQLADQALVVAVERGRRRYRDTSAQRNFTTPPS